MSQHLENAVPDEITSSETGIKSPARRQLLAMATAVGGAAFAGAIFKPAHADLVASVGKVLYLDPIVLNFAFEMEELQKEFYSRASLSPEFGKLTDKQRNLINLFAMQDKEHFDMIDGLRFKLSYKPGGRTESSNTASSRRPKSFHFGKLGSSDELLNTALDIKETVLFGYHGAVGLIHDGALLGAAAAIAGVEGRHAAILRESMGLDPVPAPFEGALVAQVSGQKLSKYGFVGGASI